jgi:release factor glutamine methyltransferase
MAQVYSPAEDSWLLEEYLLKQNLAGKVCLDFGCGSGIQAIAMLNAGAKEVLSVDVNVDALKETGKKVKGFLIKAKKSGAQFLGQFLGARKSEYFSNIKEKFDLIAFNPPYVPSDEVKWRDLDGGENGRTVIDKFISKVKVHLNPKGVVVLLISSLNNPDEVIGEFKKKGFVVSIESKKKLFFEELIILRAALK